MITTDFLQWLVIGMLAVSVGLHQIGDFIERVKARAAEQEDADLRDPQAGASHMSDTPTPEQIREMPAGPEMDALVATLVMGWELAHGAMWVQGGGEWIPKTHWHPSTDLNDAFSLDVRGIWRLPSGNWYARMSDCSAPLFTSPAPALAICRAALIAKLEADT